MKMNTTKAIYRYFVDYIQYMMHDIIYHLRYGIYYTKQ